MFIGYSVTVGRFFFSEISCVILMLQVGLYTPTPVLSSETAPNFEKRFSDCSSIWLDHKMQNIRTALLLFIAHQHSNANARH